MSVDADEVRALARAFARRLEHLRAFRGVAYVGAAPIPGAEPSADAKLAASEAPAPEPEPEPVQAALPPQTEHNPQSQQSSYSRERPQSPRPDNRSGGARSEPPRAAATAAEQWPAAKKLEYLRERNVGDCRRCPLARTRRNIVFGVGNPEAEIMFVGEAPGADEDRLGEPFVGAAGRRLDQWIERLGMSRADVYIANVLKCRPPGNRDPHPQEIERCAPFLHAQIRAIAPRVLIALGRFSGCLLLGRESKLWEMRGKVHGYREPKTGVEIPLIVTYHPAYVLRSEQPRRGAPPGQPDRGGAIKSEDEKVLADLARAASLVRTRV
ncbi:MAG: uracil-DNA glycosylase family protein [Enhygromyxa sp.]